MSGGGKSDSPIRAILVAVVIALIAGSSAPWWWSKIFPAASAPRTPTIDIRQSPETKGPATGEEVQRPVGVGACAAGSSPNNEFHDVAASNGSWDWNCNGQVEREWSTCENLTRSQCDPNTNATGAPPGFCSELRAPSGCTPRVAQCGQAGWIYPCFYNPADGRCHAGGYETAAVMRCR
jgi:hypothetical protein